MPEDDVGLEGFAFDPGFLAHRSNLAQKERRAAKATGATRALLDKALAAYVSFNAALSLEAIAAGRLEEAVGALEEYLNVAKRIEAADPLFNWRSDYAGSVVPEFLYKIVHVRLWASGLRPRFTSRNSVVELLFPSAPGQTLRLRRKNQDFCLGFHEVEIHVEGESVTLIPPVVVCEVKTNIDINKLNGLDFSATRLKRTFPNTTYFLVTETIDFSLGDNYATAAFDEVFVLRKQVRSEARRNKKQLCADVFESLLEDVYSRARRASSVLGHVYGRLESGRLIHV